MFALPSARAFLPTGSSDGYVGEGVARIAPHVVFAGDVDRFAYAASASYTTRRIIDRAMLGVPLGRSFRRGGGDFGLREILVGPRGTPAWLGR